MKKLEDNNISEESHLNDNVYPQHEPYGKGVGVMPGRVVWAYDPASVTWDGTGYWWQTDHFSEDVIRCMVDKSIAVLGNQETVEAGWNVLFGYVRKKFGETGKYVSGEKIAIKTNINGCALMEDDTTGQTEISYTNPVLLKALLGSLVESAGVAPVDITVYDVSRMFPDYMVELCTEGVLQGIQFVGRDNGEPDKRTPIRWSSSFEGQITYFPSCVTEAKYMINLANLKGHNFGVTLCAKNHFGDRKSTRLNSSHQQ